MMFPIYMRKKEKKNQPPLPLLCSQRLGSILFPFVQGDDGGRSVSSLPYSGSSFPRDANAARSFSGWSALRKGKVVCLSL